MGGKLERQCAQLSYLPDTPRRVAKAGSLKLAPVLFYYVQVINITSAVTVTDGELMMTTLGCPKQKRGADQVV